MTDNFKKCISFVLQYEGGYTINPNDSGNWTGGECGIGQCNGTNYGISAANYPTIDIASLTQDQAIDIYERDYWSPINGNNLPAGIDCVTFDASVNQGIHKAAILLQGIIRVKQDGVIGPITIASIVSKNADDVIREFTSARIAAYHADTGFSEFGNGWISRANACQSTSLEMV